MFTNRNNATWCRCFSFKTLCLSLQEPFIPAGVVFDERFSSNDRLKSSLFNEIFVYQELFCVVTLLPSSRKQNERRRQRENEKRNRFYKQNKNSERTTYLQVVKLDLNMAMRWSR